MFIQPDRTAQYRIGPGVAAQSPCSGAAQPGVEPTPPWPWIYALIPLLVGLLLLARRQPLSRSGHLFVQCAIVLLVYGLLALWLNAKPKGHPPIAGKQTRPIYVIHVTVPDGPSAQQEPRCVTTETKPLGQPTVRAYLPLEVEAAPVEKQDL